jgi:hypothetical protein
VSKRGKLSAIREAEETTDTLMLVTMLFIACIGVVYPAVIQRVYTRRSVSARRRYRPWWWLLINKMYGKYVYIGVIQLML